MLTPFSAVYLGMRYGVKAAGVVVFACCLILAGLVSTHAMIAFLALYGVGAILLPYFLHRSISWDKVILYTGAVTGCLVAISVLVVTVVNGLSLSAVVNQAVQIWMDEGLALKHTAAMTADQIKEFDQFVQLIRDYLQGAFFGLFIANIIAMQALNLVVFQRVKVQGEYYKGPSFSRWQTQPQLIWLLIIGGFLQLVPHHVVQTVGWNILLVILPLYFFQGLAVVHYFLRHKNYPRSVKSMLYLLLLVVNPLPVIVTSVGVFDLWIDFRRPRQKQI